MREQGMADNDYSTKDGPSFKIGSGFIHAQAEQMHLLATTILAKMPTGAPGRTELQNFSNRLAEAVQILDDACDELGEPGNPMYRPYTLP
jgi:hypothetical protein